MAGAKKLVRPGQEIISQGRWWFVGIIFCWLGGLIYSLIVAKIVM
jgi:hypothetical protein